MTAAAVVVPEVGGGEVARAGRPSALAMLAGDANELPPEYQADAILGRFLLGYAGHTRRAYARDLVGYFAWLSDETGVDPLAVRRSVVDLYARHLSEQRGLSPATVARKLSSLSGFYEYALAEDVITRSPLAGVKRPKVGQDSPTLGLDQEQARALLAAARQDGPRSRALVALLMLDGLRSAEALGADVEDLGGSLGHRTLTVLRKGGARRTLALAPPAAAAIDEYLDGRETGPLFVTSTGRRWQPNGAFLTIRRLARAAGTPQPDKITPHSLRHTFVTLAREAGVPLEDVQDQAGHADPRTTRRYDRGRHNLDRSPVYALAAFLSVPT